MNLAMSGSHAPHAVVATPARPWWWSWNWFICAVGFLFEAPSQTSSAGWRLAAFTTGLRLVWIAVASPLATLDHQSLTIHMMKHLLLTTVAAPLVLVGAPVFPLACGLPKVFIKSHPALGFLPARWLHPRAVLAGGNRGRNRMASSRCVSVGHAFRLGASLGGRVFSGGWPLVLEAHRPVVAECDEVASDGPWLCTSFSPRCLVTFFPHSSCSAIAKSTRAICPQLSCSVCLLSRIRNAQAR